MRAMGKIEKASKGEKVIDLFRKNDLKMAKCCKKYNKPKRASYRGKNE